MIEGTVVARAERDTELFQTLSMEWANDGALLFRGEIDDFAEEIDAGLNRIGARCAVSRRAGGLGEIGMQVDG